MDPLAVVEGELGSVDTWPSSLLSDMFCKEPSVGRRVASFLHGKGISAKLGVPGVVEERLRHMQWAKCLPITL